MWQRNENGATICLDCHSQEKKNRASRSPQRSGSSASSENSNSSTFTTNHSNQTQSEKSTVKPTTTVSTRRTTRARERNNKAKQQQTQSGPTVSTSTPPSPAANCNSVGGNKGQPEKTSTKPANGERDNGEEFHQKSRRSLQLKQGHPMKAPSSEAMIVTSDSIIHKVISCH